MTLRRMIASCTLALLSVAASGQSAPTLFERMGGRPRLDTVVAAYVDKLSTDPRTRRSFADSDLERVKRGFAELLCELSAGPCKYSGDSMRDIHAGHGIDDREFLAGVELLREAMREASIPLRERNEVLALLAPMKRDVVEPTRDRGADSK